MVMSDPGSPEHHEEGTPAGRSDEPQPRGGTERRRLGAEGDTRDREAVREAELSERTAEERDRRPEREQPDVVEGPSARHDQQQRELKQRRRQPTDRGPAQMDEELATAPYWESRLRTVHELSLRLPPEREDQRAPVAVA